jgi:mono/diheme cytochrome c family protein
MHRKSIVRFFIRAGGALALAACHSDNKLGPAGPDNPGTPAAHQLGDAVAGKDVFLFETFGNEGFWTDAVKLPAGMVAKGVTPVQALGLGLVVDVDRLSPEVKTQVAADLAADPTGASSALLNNPATTLALLNANAIPGFAVKDTNGDGVLDVASGDKVGATCALCHTSTDGSVLNIPGKGSIGKRIDGAANHNLDFGTLVSLGANSRALYPLLQLQLAANANSTLGRAATGLTEQSTEAEVDAYLTDKSAYPVGMFDDTFDGNGDPMHNAPLFAQGLAGPYGSEGTFDKQDDFANTVYTGLLDPTFLTTAGGRAFLHKLGGAAGDEIASDYVAILAETGVTGYPYVQATAPANAADAGGLSYPLGARVDATKLANLNAFVFGLPAPAGKAADQKILDRGEKKFRNSGCTGCHNSDQTIPVPTFIVKMKDIFPGDAPVTLAQRDPPLNPVLNTPGSIFDDKMAVVNASIRGGLERGTALPMLLDLARKPVFLHDNSVASLEELLNPTRGATVPHPFYIEKAEDRTAVIAFLESR